MVQLSNSSVVSSGNVETARSALGLGEQSPRMLRMIVLATGAAYFAWQLTIAGLAPSQWGTSFPITVLLAAVCALTYTLSSQRHVAATLTWLAGLALTISAALWLFRSPEVALLYALLPLNGMLIWGWPAALLAEFVATGLVLVASTSPSLRPFPPAYPAIVTLGGASVGDHDFIHDVLVGEGMALDFWKIAMRPGKPLMFGTRGTTLIFGLPGNPVSAMVTAMVFIRPALRKWLGHAEPSPWRLPLAEPTPPNTGRRHFMRARLLHTPAGPQLQPIPQTDSGHTSSLAQADMLIIQPEFDPGQPAGSLVEAIPLENF